MAGMSNSRSRKPARIAAAGSKSAAVKAGTGSQAGATVAVGVGAVGVGAVATPAEPGLPLGADEDPRPLYVQARDALMLRIRTGAWKPGQLIPNEFEIAAELAVSQGTARKALDQMAQDGLLVRRQGRGTFVAKHTPQNVMFRFFNIADERGRQIQPESDGARAYHGEASAEDAAMLQIQKGAQVLRIRRVRRRGGKPFLHETIVLPAELFPGLSTQIELPNTLYDVFQRDFGVHVAGANEQITIVISPPEIAAQLGIPTGTPLLKISRVALDIDNRHVEWRTSYVHLDGAHYFAKLGLG